MADIPPPTTLRLDGLGESSGVPIGVFGQEFNGPNQASSHQETQVKALKALIHYFGRRYVSRVCRSEYKDQRFRRINERPVEYRFVFQCVAQLTPTTVLDVGTGTSALPNLLRTCGPVVTAIDNIKDYWPNGIHNRCFHIINDDITQSQLPDKYELITCVSVLEHIIAHREAVKSMVRLLAPGGCIALTFPYNENTCIDNIYRHPQAGYGQDLPYPCHVFSRACIDDWLCHTNAQVIAQEYWQIFTGDFWTCGKRLQRPFQVDASKKHQLTCLLLQKTN